MKRRKKSDGMLHDAVESALRSVIERKCITYFSLSLLWQLFQNRTEMQLFHMDFDSIHRKDTCNIWDWISFIYSKICIWIWNGIRWFKLACEFEVFSVNKTEKIEMPEHKTMKQLDSQIMITFHVVANYRPTICMDCCWN